MSDHPPFQDAVLISDQDDSLLRRMNELDDGSLQTQEGFTPKEIQMSVFGASIQLYNSGRHGRDYEGQILAVKEAATILSVILNVDVIGGIFEEIVAEHHHPYDVFARAQSEIEGIFKPEPR
jgi:dTDP-D-glucose 4,6-dehydratase